MNEMIGNRSCQDLASCIHQQKNHREKAMNDAAIHLIWVLVPYCC